MRSPITLVKLTLQQFSEDDCMMMAAALSYYTIFSLPPLLFTTIAAAGAIFGQSAVESHLLGQARELIGSSAAEQIGTMLNHVEERVAQGGAALLVSLGALLFAATGVLVQLQAALNRAWEVRPDPEAGSIRNFLMKRLISFAIIVAVAFLLLVSLVLSAAISAFGGAVFGLLPDQASQGLLYLTELTSSLILFTVVFAAMFHFLPDAQVQWRDVWAGAFLTALLFAVGKFALSLYIGNTDVAATFGAAGSLAIIMLWVYYASAILLLGAEFTQVWARLGGSPIRPEPGSVRFTYQPVKRHEPERATVTLPPGHRAS